MFIQHIHLEVSIHTSINLTSTRHSGLVHFGIKLTCGPFSDQEYMQGDDKRKIKNVQKI